MLNFLKIKIEILKVEEQLVEAKAIVEKEEAKAKAA
jgi:hypothetical protein